MNQALDAVRYASPDAFSGVAKLASASAQRNFLRHLADLCSWSCAFEARQHHRSTPSCDHEACDWVCFQSDVELAAELNISDSAVKRTRRALTAGGWITVTRSYQGRGWVSHYSLDRSKLIAATRPGKRNHLRGLKVSARQDEGSKSSSNKFGKGATRPEKGGNAPYLYKKNPLEPVSSSQASIGASVRGGRMPHDSGSASPRVPARETRSISTQQSQGCVPACEQRFIVDESASVLSRDHGASVEW